MRMPITLIAAASALALSAPAFAKVIAVAPGDGAQARLQEALIVAAPGDVVELGAGRFQLSDGLSLDVKGVTLRGAGMDATVLDFTGQQGSGEGLLVTSSDVTLRDFAVENTKGDGIKSKGADRVVYYRLRVAWTGGPKETNGAYGIYPVSSTGVLVDGCKVSGASDAGIYVGQSKDITVRYNYVEQNVAGIEIENSRNALVTGNLVTRNTGGILVFDLPNLSREGARVRVYNNVVRGNNTVNFAPEGNIVGVVPTGTGMLVMAFSDVEIFDNTIEDNQSAAIVIVDYQISGLTTDDTDYDGTPRRVYVHDNRYSNNSYAPRDLASDIAAMFEPLGGVPMIVYDGLGETGGRFEDKDRICIQEDPSVTRGIVFGAGGSPSVDQSYFDCAHASLPAVVLDTPDVIAEGEKPLTDAEIAALCTPEGNQPNFDAVEVNCNTLSAYNLFADKTEPREAANLGIGYDLITPLFTDYAHKYRFIYVPPGKQAAYNSKDALDFPVGTIIAKTFTMPRDFLNAGAGEEILETRLLIHRKDGWKALPFTWRADGSDADLTVAGGTRKVSWIHTDGSNRSTDYVIPDANSCKNCHSLSRPETGSGVNMETVIVPIGPKARFLNTDNVYDGKTVNQLAHMKAQGVLAGVPSDLAAIQTVADWEDTAAPLEQRAKAYLDSNCAHCHNPGGFASNSGLFLEYWRPVDTAYGVCKSPVAAGAGSGGLQYAIVPGAADQSIMTYRMDSNDADVRMPEIGRSVIHTEGVALIRDWINSQSGGCK